MKTQIQVFCDFDGTITKGDTVDLLLERLALPSWREVEDLWERGEIGSRECMARQVPLIQGGWAAIEDVLKTVEVDNSFATFVQWCRSRKVNIGIVSDGLDRVINHLLRREGIQVDHIWSNRLVEREDGLRLEFPPNNHRVVCSSGLCKCQVLDKAGPFVTKVVVGDGRSDFCWSANADILFAKDKLYSYCKTNNIHAYKYSNFVQIRVLLEEMMTATQPVPAGTFIEAPLFAQT